MCKLLGIISQKRDIVLLSGLEGMGSLEILLGILREIHPEVDFIACETLINDGILDSLDIVRIIAEINDKYDVVVSANEIIPENFNSARALYALIERLQD